MKKIGLFLVGISLVFLLISISIAKEISVVIYEGLSCPKVKIVLHHKTLAVRLIFSGTPSPIVNKKDGSIRCPTIEELIEMIMKLNPDYYLKEYIENPSEN